MKIPIAYALSYPDRLPVQTPRLDLFSIGQLSFFPPDTETFPCLSLAYEAARKGGTLPAVLNAANEVAVNAFLDHRLNFLGISELIRTVMDLHSPTGELNLQAILNADNWAREKAEKIVADRMILLKPGNG
jgi:1-deoxy-D-xylulose-5-phosphate reductoisomerase